MFIVYLYVLYYVGSTIYKLVFFLEPSFAKQRFYCSGRNRFHVAYWAFRCRMRPSLAWIFFARPRSLSLFSQANNKGQRTIYRMSSWRIYTMATRSLSLLLVLLLLAALSDARPVVRNIQSAHEFDRLLKKHATETGLPVIVDFYSDSCGPCRMMAPIFKQVAKDYTDRAVFVKVDTNRQPELSSRYQIRSLPTFQYFVGGRKVDQAVGGIGEQGLRQQADQVVRQAEIENTQMTLEALTAYYQQQDASKSESDVTSVHQKCVGMTKGVDECVGAAANQLARRLKKKYGKPPKLEPRFDPEKAKSSSSGSGNKETDSNKNKRKAAENEAGPNLHLATLEQLQAEVEQRLDDLREAQVESEDADEDEADPDFHRWMGPGEFPERVVIVGGGPAGLAAALYAARAGLEPLVIAPSMGGQLQGKGVEVENYPGVGMVSNQTTGPALIAAMRTQAAHFGAVFEDDVVYAVTVDRDPAKAYAGEGPEPIRIHTNATGLIETHSLIVATGAEANWLSVPGEWELRGGGVSSCAVCDGFLYAGRDVIIVGGGDAAMEDALVLARTSRKVTVVHRRDQFRASKVLADRVLNHPLITVLWNSTVQEIIGKQVEGEQSDEEAVDMDAMEKVVEGVILKNTATGETQKLACDAVFVAIGHTPATSFLRGVVDFDPNHPGYIHVGKGTTATSVPGIFAAGDVSDAVYRQAITSAGSGAAAALDAERYLSEHGLGNEAAELEAELLADLMNEAASTGAASSSYNVYEDAGGRMQGMKESMAAAGEL